MRKIIPSILIALILVNLFAPFTLRVNSGKIVAKKSVAEANKDLAIQPHVTTTDKLITIKLDVTRLKGSDNHPFIYIITDKKVELNAEAFGGNKNPGPIEIFTAIIQANYDLTKIFNLPAGTEIIKMENINLGMSGVDKKQFTITADNPKIKPNTEYYLNYFSGSWDGFPDENSTLLLVSNLLFKTADVGQTLEQDLDGITAGDGYMPACWIGLWSGGISVSGCIAQLLYTLFFRPTSFLFGLAGMFFDWTLDYSVKDSSYTTAFVTEGWGVVRDFVNLFFIFVLLWIAFSTILNLHGFKTKEMIINVVIIGLFMNFSLFITKVIIDASNITARVFYNADNIKLKDKNGKEIVREAGKPISLSEVIVSKVDPQRLILDASQVGSIPDRGGQITSDRKTEKGISNGTFILVTLLASAVNVVGMIVFLMTGLIFIARVIGLWIAMILVPLAFFSYMVPAMQDVDMIGWKKWWPNTLKLAFLAPIFVFFMYLIVKFLGTDFLKDLMGGSEYKESAEFVIAIIVPFAFIMILMNRAKAIAVKFAGDIGTAVTKAAVIGGGVALAGGAMGAAFLGRNILGKGVASISRGKDAVHYGQQKIAFNNKLEEWEKKGGKKSGMPKPTWEDHKKQNNVKDNLFTRIGGNLNAKQKKVGDIDHARHDVDEIKKKAGLEGIDNKNLSGADKQRLKETYIKEKKSEIESDIRSGKSPMTDASGQPIKDKNGAPITGGESGFKSAMRDDVSHKMGMDPNNIDHGTGELTDAAKKKVEDELNVQFNAVLETSKTNAGGKKFDDLEKKSNQKVGGFERAFANSNKSTYDPRNISDLKSDRREGILTKIPVALMAGIAIAVRSGLKDGIGVDHGKGQGDLLKDLGKTIKDAIGHMSAKVASSVGKVIDEDHKGGGDHGGGHH